MFREKGNLLMHLAKNSLKYYFNIFKYYLTIAINEFAARCSYVSFLVSFLHPNLSSITACVTINFKITVIIIREHVVAMSNLGLIQDHLSNFITFQSFLSLSLLTKF